MINLWSQVGRLGCSCPCPSCLTTKHALVRRVSTAIGRIRARPKTSSTFLYSAIFAAATVTDGHFKRQRRAHWDDAIQTAKDQLDQTQRAVNDILKDEITYEEQDSHTNLMNVANVMKFAPKPGASRPPAPRSTEANHYPSPWGNEFAAPQSLWSGDNQRAKAYDRRWSKKKIANAELAAARLAVRLIMLIDVESQTMINLVVLPEAVREIARLSRSEQRQLLSDLQRDISRINTLEPWESRSGAIAGMTIPQYAQREDNSHFPIVEELNESIIGLMNAFQKQDISFKALIVKVCHNLLVSPAPPDLQTINILLLGFHSLDKRTSLRHGVVDAVVHFCRTVKVRPNEITCAAILRSYIKRNASSQFANFIALMRAADGMHGLMLAKPGVIITESSQGRLIPHATIEGKVFQAVHPSPVIFWQIVRGVCKFSGIQAAIEICKNFGTLAWGLDRTCLWELLRRCALDEDWTSGEWVWNKVEIYCQRHNSDVSRIVGMMLAFCLQCDEQTMFSKIFRDALEQKYNFMDGKATPAILTDLAAKALRDITQSSRMHDPEEEEEEEEEENEEKETDTAWERKRLGMASKHLHLHDLEPEVPSHHTHALATAASELVDSRMWIDIDELEAAKDRKDSSDQRSSSEDSDPVPKI